MDNQTVWIIDYDISSEEAYKKRFYRRLHKLLGITKFSSSFSYVLDDEKKAREFYAIAKRFARPAHLYKAQRVQ
jgi:hypothetical protein